VWCILLYIMYAHTLHINVTNDVNWETVQLLHWLWTWAESERTIEPALHTVPALQPSAPRSAHAPSFSVTSAPAHPVFFPLSSALYSAPARKLFNWAIVRPMRLILRAMSSEVHHTEVRFIILWSGVNLLVRNSEWIHKSSQFCMIYDLFL